MVLLKIRNFFKYYYYLTLCILRLSDIFKAIYWKTNVYYPFFLKLPNLSILVQVRRFPAGKNSIR